MQIAGKLTRSQSLYREGLAFIVAVSLHPDIDRPQLAMNDFRYHRFLRRQLASVKITGTFGISFAREDRKEFVHRAAFWA